MAAPQRQLLVSCLDKACIAFRRETPLRWTSAQIGGRSRLRLLRLRADRRVQEAVLQQDSENMVSLVACVPSHIDERDHLFDQLWPFEELDIAFIGIGFNFATLSVAYRRNDQDVLECMVPNKFSHSSRGWRAGEVQQRPVLPRAHGESSGVPALNLARDAFLVFAWVHRDDVYVTGVIAVICRSVGDVHAHEVTLEFVVPDLGHVPAVGANAVR
jgi:hypothetical protein